MSLREFLILCCFLALYGCMKGGDVNAFPSASSPAVCPPSWAVDPSSHRFPDVATCYAENP